MLTKFVIVKLLKQWGEDDEKTMQFACKTTEIIIGIINKKAKTSAVELYSGNVHVILEKTPNREVRLVTLSDLRPLARMFIENEQVSRDEVRSMLVGVEGKIQKTYPKKGKAAIRLSHDYYQIEGMSF